jgi:hypothetical protein
MRGLLLLLLLLSALVAHPGAAADTCEYVEYEEPTEISRLTPGSLGTAGGYFGWSVALSGSTAVVGGIYKGRGAFVMDRGWGVTEILTPTYPFSASSSSSSSSEGDEDEDEDEDDDPVDDGFGYSVAVTTSDDGKETVVAVGATKDAAGADNGGGLLDTGAVYIFTRPVGAAGSGGGAWNLTQRLDVDGLRSGDFFGAAVALDGDRLVVGAHKGSSSSSSSSSSNSGDDGDGSDGSGGGTASDAGRAFVFERKKEEQGQGGEGSSGNGEQRTRGFVLVAELLRSEGAATAANDYYGLSVSVDGDVAVVGAHDADL